MTGNADQSDAARRVQKQVEGRAETDGDRPVYAPWKRKSNTGQSRGSGAASR